MIVSFMVALVVFFSVIKNGSYQYARFLLIIIYIYLFAMFLRPIGAAAIWILLLSKKDDYTAELYSVQMLIYKIPLFALFFMMFKFKKIYILLNFNGDDPQVVIDRLVKFVFAS